MIEKSIIDKINNYHEENKNLECEFESVDLDKVIFVASGFITLAVMGHIKITFENPSYFNFELFGENGYFYSDDNKSFIEMVADKDEIKQCLKRDLAKDENLFIINVVDKPIIICAENIKAEIN